MNFQARLQRLESSLKPMAADDANRKTPPTPELLEAYRQTFERAATERPMGEKRMREMQGWIDTVVKCREQQH